MLVWKLGYKYLFELLFSPSLSFFFFGYILRSGIAGSYGSSISVFWETSILSSTPTESVYIPSNSVWRFPFHCILANICYLYSFWSWPCWQMWGDTSLWLWFAFPWWLVTEHLFMWLLAICISCLENCILRFLPIFHLISFCFFFWCWVVWASKTSFLT